MRCEAERMTSSKSGTFSSFISHKIDSLRFASGKLHFSFSPADCEPHKHSIRVNPGSENPPSSISSAAVDRYRFRVHLDSISDFLNFFLADFDTSSLPSPINTSGDFHRVFSCVHVINSRLFIIGLSFCFTFSFF